MFLLPAICGLASGVISGMGIGGGTILIPALTIFLNLSQHDAQGINLLYFIPTAITALAVHIKNKNIVYKTAAVLALAGAVGAGFGAYLANKTNGNLLKKLFAAFLLIMGIYEILKKDKEKSKK